jgi:hypothetical protein
VLDSDGVMRPPRKVVILGDTINSVPIGPLAAGCDVLSHEATFSKVGGVEQGMCACVYACSICSAMHQ